MSRSSRNESWKTSAIILGLACLMPTPTAGLADPAKLSTNELLLQQGMQELNALEPSMDQKTLRQVGAMQNILKRVCLDRQHATDSEVQVAAVLLRVDPNRGPDDAEKQLQDLLGQMPGVASVPKFSTGTRRVPGGGYLAYVSVSLAGKSKTVVEFPGGAAGKGAPQEGAPQQAALVASRLQAIQSTDSLWWTRLAVDPPDDGASVLVSDLPGGDLVTVDPALSGELSLSPHLLAAQIVFDLRHAMDTCPDAGAADLAPAVEQRIAGDEAYDRHDLTGAEKDYRQAIRAAQGYAIAYDRLGNLYTELREQDKARAVLTAALNIGGLDPGWRNTLQQSLARTGRPSSARPASARPASARKKSHG